MKKLAVLFFVLFLFFACSSGNSDGGEVNDSDRPEEGTDADRADDSDSAAAPDADETETSDSQEPATDADGAADTSDSDTAGDGGTGSDTDATDDSEVGPASDADNTADDSDAGTDDPESGCPSGFECRGGYCANTSDPKFFCAENSDCGEGLTCTSSSLPSGQCHGCSYASDCPGGGTDDAVRCITAGSSGYCMRICHADEDCSEGMTCRTSGLGSFCGKKDCSTASDCPANYTCTQSSDSSEGSYCARIRCNN